MNCDCIAKVNEKLKHAFGTRLSTTILFDKKMNTEDTLTIATVRLDDSRAPKRQKPQPVLVTFCPFCGTKAAKPVTGDDSETSTIR